MRRYATESLLRPAVELYSVAVATLAAALCLTAPWAFALNATLGRCAAAGFLALAAVRLRQACSILRFRRYIRRLPRYIMTSRDIPVSRERLFIGRGFRWEPHHTQRLLETYRPQYRRYVEPPRRYHWARRLEARLEFAPPRLRALTHLTRSDHPLNPVRPGP